mgnify:CR=1 FL=1
MQHRRISHFTIEMLHECLKCVGHSKKPRQVLVHHWGAMHSNASLASRRHLCLGQSWIFCGGQNNSTCVVLNPTWGNSRVIGRRRVRKVLTCFLSGFRLVRYLTRVSGFRGACQRQIASIHLAQVQPSMASQAKEKCFCCCPLALRPAMSRIGMKK